MMRRWKPSLWLTLVCGLLALLVRPAAARLPRPEAAGGVPLDDTAGHPLAMSALPSNPTWMVKSDQSASYFGYVATAGDVNADGYSDVIVGAPWYDNGQENEGRVYVYYGSAAGLSTTPNWTAEGDQEGAHFGTAVGTAGDVNDDGYSDIIVGADAYSNGEAGEGSVFVWYGSANGVNNGTAGTPANADWMAESNDEGAGFGESVATAGDVNDDGYSDIIVGASLYDSRGWVFVWHGSANGVNDGTNGTPANAAWTAESDESSTGFGALVGTAGDVNADGYSDVIVGAYLYRNDETGEGAVFVWHGSANGVNDGTDGSPANAAWMGEANQADAQFGTSAGTAGDVNADGYSDIIVGAPLYDSRGWTFVWHGSANGVNDGTNGTPANATWTAANDQGNAYWGTSVGTAGDVNNDGYSDVVVGVPRQSNDQLSEGSAFVWHGSASGVNDGTAGTPANADWMAEGNSPDSWFGVSVGTAGDVDNNHHSDVIVGAHSYDDEGAAFVYRTLFVYLPFVMKN